MNRRILTPLKDYTCKCIYTNTRSSIKIQCLNDLCLSSHIKIPNQNIPFRYQQLNKFNSIYNSSTNLFNLIQSRSFSQSIVNLGSKNDDLDKTKLKNEAKVNNEFTKKPDKIKKGTESNIPEYNTNNDNLLHNHINIWKHWNDKTYYKNPFTGYTSWRVTKAALLDSVQGFWPRMKLRMKFWVKSLIERKWGYNDFALMFSWLFVGNTLLFIIGTTTFFSLILFALNTVRAQAYFAQILSDYLTKQTGFEIKFQSAIVPRWKQGVIRLSNVKIVCNDETWINLQRKLWIESGKDENLFNPQEIDTNWTFWDISVKSLDVTLSFYKFWEGKGFVDKCSMKGVRGVIDRRHVYWPSDWVPTRRKPQEGDFYLEGLTIDDMMVTICHPNFRPYNVSVYRAELPLLRKQWLLYDFMRANQMNGLIENCLFSIHKPQRHDIIIDDDNKNQMGKVQNNWDRVSHLKLNGLPIDHLNGGAEGPFGWIVSGTLDIDLQFMFPQVTDTDLLDVLKEGILEFKEISKVTMDHVTEDGLIALLNNKNFKTWLELRKDRLTAKIRESSLQEDNDNMAASLVTDAINNKVHQSNYDLDASLFGVDFSDGLCNDNYNLNNTVKARVQEPLIGILSDEVSINLPKNSVLDQQQQQLKDTKSKDLDNVDDIIVIGTDEKSNSKQDIKLRIRTIEEILDNNSTSKGSLNRKNLTNEGDDHYIPRAVGVDLVSVNNRTQNILNTFGYDYSEVANPKETQIELFPERNYGSTKVVALPPSPNKPNEMLMLWQVRLNDIKANVPLRSSSLTYMNAALIRPIVSYMNSSRTDISLSFGAAMDLSNFDGAWTVYSAGLIDVLSEQVGRAVTNMYTDEKERMKHLKRIGIISFQSVLKNIVSFLDYARPTFLFGGNDIIDESNNKSSTNSTSFKDSNKFPARTMGV